MASALCPLEEEEDEANSIFSSGSSLFFPFSLPNSFTKQFTHRPGKGEENIGREENFYFPFSFSENKNRLCFETCDVARVDSSLVPPWQQLLLEKRNIPHQLSSL